MYFLARYESLSDRVHHLYSEYNLLGSASSLWRSTASGRLSLSDKLIHQVFLQERPTSFHKMDALHHSLLTTFQLIFTSHHFRERVLGLFLSLVKRDQAYQTARFLHSCRTKRQKLSKEICKKESLQDRSQSGLLGLNGTHVM